MKIQELINEFYDKEYKEHSYTTFSFTNLDHNEPCDFTKFNAFMIDYIDRNNKKAILNYPASNGFVLSLVLYKTINDLNKGTSVIEKFNPETFKENQKVRIGNVVANFIGFFSKDITRVTSRCDIKMVGLSFSKRKNGNDMIYYDFIDHLPLMEPLGPEAKLSSYDNYCDQKKEIAKNSFVKKSNSFEKRNDSFGNFRKLKAGKSETVILVTDLEKYKPLIHNFYVNRTPLLDFINVSTGNYLGNLTSLNYNGTIPQIILVKNISDALFSIKENASLSFKYIYVDLNFIPNINDELDSIDEIISEKIKLYFFLPENKDYNLSGLQSREFPVFSWRPNMINQNMIEINKRNGSYMLQNFQQTIIQPYLISNEPFTELLGKLHNISDSIDESDNILKSFYCSIIRLLFFEIRSCSPENEEKIQSYITDCIENEKRIEQENYWKFLPRKDLAKTLISSLKEIESLKKESPKEMELQTKVFQLPQLKWKNICFIIFDGNNVNNDLSNISNIIRNNNLPVTSISVKTIEDFFSDFNYYDYVIIPGWLNRSQMKQIFFSNKSRQYLPVLYKCEYRWFNQSVNNWNNEFNSNNDLSKFNLENTNEKVKISIDTRWAQDNNSIQDIPEDFLNTDFYSKVFHRTFSRQNGDETIDSIPIAFNDLSFGYYTPGFEFIALNKSDYGFSCIRVSAQNIKENSLVLFRESSKDLLDDLTKEKLGDKSTEIYKELDSWKFVIQSQLEKGMTKEEVIKRLKNNGIKVSNAEFKIWLDPNNGLICPGSKESLEIIGTVFKDEHLLKNIDLIWTYASIVRGYHISIGRKISNSISQNNEIMMKLSQLSNNGFSSNVISAEIPSVGKVSILKIVNIKNTEKVPKSEVNRRKL